MIGSLMLMASFAAATPAPLLGECKVSNLWGTTLPAEIPMEQQRQLIHVQGKQIYWNTRLMPVDRAVAEIAPDVAAGDMLVIDASSAKCGTVTELAAAIEGPAACAPERCFVSSKPVPPRRKPEAPTTP